MRASLTLDAPRRAEPEEVAVRGLLLPPFRPTVTGLDNGSEAWAGAGAGVGVQGFWCPASCPWPCPGLGVRGTCWWDGDAALLGAHPTCSGDTEDTGPRGSWDFADCSKGSTWHMGTARGACVKVAFLHAPPLPKQTNKQTNNTISSLQKCASESCVCEVTIHLPHATHSCVIWSRTSVRSRPRPCRRGTGAGPCPCPCSSTVTTTLPLRVTRPMSPRVPRRRTVSS
jgi:hypothetical protein